MAIATSEDFFTVLEKSRLLEAAELDKARQLAGDAGDPTSAARLLAKEGLITRWQAGQLLAGRSAFFLGKYKLIDLLGRGGMGSVFLAEHCTMNRRVALKIIAKHVAQDPDSLKRFLTEARAIAALDHPNIVQAFSVDNEGDRYYIVMEYVAGPDLKRLVEEEGPLDGGRAADYVRQVAEGLAHAHERKIVHCDIKPSNLLVNNQGVVKILDMGLARLTGCDRPRTADGRDREDDGAAGDNGAGNGGKGDRDDAVLGSVDYLAPEQALEGPDFDHRADIYALGCTLYFLLTGRPPFPDGTLAERIMKHQTREPEDVRALKKDAPPELVRICRKMMAKKPEDRYQSAAELARALGRWRAPAPGSKPVKLLDEEQRSDGKGEDGSEGGLAAATAPRSAKAGVAPPKRNGGKPARRGAKAAVAAAAGSPKAKDSAAAKGKPDDETPAANVNKKDAEDADFKAKKDEGKADKEDKTGKEGGKETDDEKAAPAGKGALRSWLATRQGRAVAASTAILLLGGVAAGVILLVAALGGERPSPAPTATAQADEASAGSRTRPRRFEEPKLDLDVNLDALPSIPGEIELPDDPLASRRPEGPAEPTPGEEMPPADPQTPEGPPADQPPPTDEPPPADEPPKAEEPKPEPPKTEEPKPQPEPPKPKPKPPEPLKNLVAAVDLPPVGGSGPSTTEPVPLGPVQLADGATLDVQLLGGQQAARPNQQLVVTPAEGASAWTIAFQSTDPSGGAQAAEIARLALADGALTLQWLDGADLPRANWLRNCGLNVTAAGQSKFVALSRPKHVEPIVLDLERGTVRASLSLETAPPVESVRLQITSLDGQFPKSEIKPGDTIAPKMPRVADSGEMIIGGMKREAADTVEIHLNVNFLMRSQSATVEVQPFFRFPDQPGVPLTVRGLLTAHQQLTANLKAMETRRDRTRDQERRTIEAQIDAVKKALDQLTGLGTLCQALHKTGRIQYRIYCLAGDQQVELLTTAPPEGAEPAGELPGPEELNLGGDRDGDGPRRFFN
jgi:serine/threonine protein kinase